MRGCGYFNPNRRRAPCRCKSRLAEKSLTWLTIVGLIVGSPISAIARDDRAATIIVSIDRNVPASPCSPDLANIRQRANNSLITHGINFMNFSEVTTQVAVTIEDIRRTNSGLRSPTGEGVGRVESTTTTASSARNTLSIPVFSIVIRSYFTSTNNAEPQCLSVISTRFAAAPEVSLRNARPFGIRQLLIWELPPSTVQHAIDQQDYPINNEITSIIGQFANFYNSQTQRR